MQYNAYLCVYLGNFGLSNKIMNCEKINLNFKSPGWLESIKLIYK